MDPPVYQTSTLFGHFRRACPFCKEDRKSFGVDKYRAREATGAKGCRRCLTIVGGIRAMAHSDHVSFPEAWEDSVVISDYHNSDGEITVSGISLQYYVEASTQTSYRIWPPAKHHITAGGMPDTCLRFASKILQRCTDKHSCFKRKGGVLPSRLIDVDTVGLEANMVKVVEHVSSIANGTLDYAALSYCWGPASIVRSKMICMTKANITDMARGIELSKLPAVFQDAVETTRYLRLKYLWIDALCIAQGDKEDWMDECQKMGDYYSNAYVTIAANASASCDESFLNVSKYRKCREAVEVPDSEPLWGQKVFVRLSHSSLYGARHHHRFPEHESMMNSRAWTLQEALLSKRILLFLHTHVVLSCLKRQASEDGDDKPDTYLDLTEAAVYLGRRKLHQGKRLRSEDFWRLWHMTLRHYVGRELTSPSDRLLAVAGVASQLSSRSKGENRYMAGLWSDQFVGYLAWNVVHPAGHRPGEVPLELPSWSWASVLGQLAWHLGKDEGIPDLHAKLIDGDTFQESGTEFGHVNPGKIVLEGPSLQVKVKLEDFELSSDEAHLQTVPSLLNKESFHRDMHLDADSDAEIPWNLLSSLRTPASNKSTWPQITVELLLLSSTEAEWYSQARFLLLAQILGEEERYRRVGLWTPTEYWRTTSSIALKRKNIRRRYERDWAVWLANSRIKRFTVV